MIARLGKLKRRDPTQWHRKFAFFPLVLTDPRDGQRYRVWMRWYEHRLHHSDRIVETWECRLIPDVDIREASKV
jgi:hypothetical protein